MYAPQGRVLLVALALAALGSGIAPEAAARQGGASEGDPLAAEIDRWLRRLATENTSDPLWSDVKGGTAPVLERAQQALTEGRRSLALVRLAAARGDLAAASWLLERPEAVRKDQAAFEAEWSRLGAELQDALRPIPPEALADVRPALARALGEAALHQVRVFYEASLEYGRNTSPDSGLFYLGEAQAQRDFAARAGTFLGTAGPASSPLPLRPLGPELDALEGDLLAAYRPPASIDKHRDFIAASATLKTARELDAAGLRHGALLRYLQAAQRVAPLRTSPPFSPSAEVLAETRRKSLERLSAVPDPSLGRVFLEMAEADEAAAPVLLADVLPRYWAALEPPRPREPKPEAKTTVTLVRWPYT